MASVLEAKLRELIRRRLTFKGSEKLKVRAKIDGDKVSLNFSGPDDIVTEAKKRWKAKT